MTDRTAAARLKGARSAVLLAAVGMLWGAASAAQGEMGTGVPNHGVYSAATGASTIVWSVENATIPFPAGCTNITFSPTTMGMDSYKIALAHIMLARSTAKRIRFYAHSPRDGGCGVDYVQPAD